MAMPTPTKIPIGIIAKVVQAPMPTIPVIPSPHLLLIRWTDSFAVWKGPAPSNASRGTAKIVARLQAAPSSQDARRPAPGIREAICSRTSPTPAASSDHCAIRPSRCQEMPSASRTPIGLPSKLAMAAPVRATLKKTLRKVSG
jgi:hypothetical protein